MNESEKERLIKKDIESIENRVRHAFNQGYEMGLKESRSKNPNACGDAISREAAIMSMKRLEEEDIERYGCSIPEGFDGRPAIEALQVLPSVTPQPRMGRWIQKEEEGEAEPFIIWECSECHCVDEDGKPSYKYCPQCGAKMEVEE